MIKKIVFSTDLPIELFAVQIANLICSGLENFSTWPNHTNELENGIYIFAYRNQPPEDVIFFLETYGGKEYIHYFFTKEGENWSKNKRKKGGLKKAAAVKDNSEQKDVGMLINAVYDFLKSQTK